MIASTSPNIQVSGTLSGEKIGFKMAENKMAKLQGIFINMYADPELAALREIACNGRDACIEAGSERPIEVTLPTMLTPFLTIRDFGVGLMTDDLHNIYTQYGASTKEDTNEQTGYLGIGSKAPLAYAPQFTISSVKNGLRIECVVSLDEDGAGQMQVLNPEGEPTDEPSGTEVVIPAKRHNSLASKARMLFSYWPEGSVLVDGQPVSTVAGQVLSDKPATVRIKTSEDGSYRDVRIGRMVIREGSGQSIIVMGGVPYPISDDDDQFGLGHSRSVVAWVGMGEIAFAPSREALARKPITLQTLKAVHQQFDYVARKTVQDGIAQAKTAGEALRLMLSLTAMLPERLRETSYRYKGKEIPAKFEMPGGDDVKMTVLSQRPHKLSSCARYHSVASPTASDAIWFYGYDRPSFSAGQRKKINYWLKNSSDSPCPSWPYGDKAPEHIILVEKMPPSDFLDADRCFDWQTTIKPVRIPRAHSGGGGNWNEGRLAGSYDVWIGNTWREEVPAEDFDLDEPLYYFEKTHRWTERHDANSYLGTVAHFTPDCTTVWLPSNRVAKFKRNFPEAVSLQSAVAALRDEWLDTLDDVTKERLAFSDAVRSSEYEKLAKYGPFECPDIQGTIDRLAELKDPTFKAVLAERAALVGVPTFTTEWENTLTAENFPLAISYYGSFSDSNTAHIALYIKAVCADRAAKVAVDNTPEAE